MQGNPIWGVCIDKIESRQGWNSALGWWGFVYQDGCHDMRLSRTSDKGWTQLNSWQQYSCCQVVTIVIPTAAANIVFSKWITVWNWTILNILDLEFVQVIATGLRKWTRGPVSDLQSETDIIYLRPVDLLRHRHFSLQKYGERNEHWIQWVSQWQWGEWSNAGLRPR